MAKKFKVDNTFDISNKPVGEYEKIDLLNHVLRFAKSHGLRLDPSIPVHARALQVLNVLKLDPQGRIPSTSDLWGEYGRTFGIWKILAFNYDRVQQIYMLRTGTDVVVVYKRYWSRNQYYYVQLDTSMRAIKESKMTESEFIDRMKRMTRSPFPKHIAAGEQAIHRFILEMFHNPNNLD